MNINVIIILVSFVFVLVFFVSVFLFRNRNKYKLLYQKIYEKYKDLVDLDEYKEKTSREVDEIIKKKDEEIEKFNNEILKLKTNYSEKQSYYEKLLNEEIEKNNNEILKLKTNYSEKYSYYEKLLKEISIYEETEDIFSYGLYKPHFDFNTSEKYKNKIQEIRDIQKECIKNNNAAICTTEWSVNGSKAEGTKQTKRYIKLMLRAFNGECDAMISDVRWNNITKMEERLEKSFEAINKMGETHCTKITQEYKELKVKELRLAYEYQEKIYQEKEEQKMLKEQMREEEKLQKEIERKQKEIEKQLKEEAELEEKLKQAYEKGMQAEAEKYEEKIKELNQIIENSQRAISQAQQTKIGHIYVISNIGSFGENVFKIGMTRRLDPMERVNELGDASVPFRFDVHAMIKSNNAPELENSIHKYFDKKRVNLVNNRKEFFYVTLDDIEEFAKKNNLDVEFTKIAEARDYRESEALRSQNEKKKQMAETNLNKIPNSI